MGVVGLRGEKIPDSSGAIPDVVERLEGIIAEARRGEIISFAAVVIRPNMEIGTIASSISGKRHLLVAGTVYLQNDLAEDVKE